MNSRSCTTATSFGEQSVVPCPVVAAELLWRAFAMAARDLNQALMEDKDELHVQNAKTGPEVARANGQDASASNQGPPGSVNETEVERFCAYSRIDQEDMSGLRLMRVEGEMIVYSVDEGSPAYVAGMRDRDTIVRIGGKPASQYELADIRRLLRSGDGKEIVMTSKRGSHETTSTIHLKEKQPK